MGKLAWAGGMSQSEESLPSIDTGNAVISNSDPKSRMWGLILTPQIRKSCMEE